jgi:hypothetical protein
MQWENISIPKDWMGREKKVSKREKRKRKSQEHLIWPGQ